MLVFIYYLLRFSFNVKILSVIFQFQLFESWGDPYYLGLNGLEFYDQDGRLMELNEKSILLFFTRND